MLPTTHAFRIGVNESDVTICDNVQFALCSSK